MSEVNLDQFNSKKIGITERGDPAFDFEWVKWANQFKPFILVTKSPKRIHEKFDLVSKALELEWDFIIHCTITGYGGSVFEPGVNKAEDELAIYHELINYLGPLRVILRVDPIIPAKGCIEKSLEIIREAEGPVRISFLDNYPHIKERFNKASMDPLGYDLHAPLNLRKEIYSEVESILNVKGLKAPEVCSEPGFESVGCISKEACILFSSKPIANSFKQRKDCACFGNKVELLKYKGRCNHKCLYCYWKDQ